MSRLQTSFVLGYHGCEKSVGIKAVNGEEALIRSEKLYDWLGSGTYFWEADPQRALEWAEEKSARGQCKEPFVIGAVIDLGNCLDLLVRENLDLIAAAADDFAAIQKAANGPMPVNRDLNKTENPDGKLRYLDCAIMNYFFKRMESADRDPDVELYDTVRGYFREGDRVFPGSGFHHKTHSQIAVRNPENIKGLFFPRPAISA